MVPSSALLILVVEDEHLVRMTAIDMLSEAGYQTIAAATADEAILILETRDDIRLVFTDIQMPGSMDGLKLAAAVQNRWPPIKIIVASGHVKPDHPELPPGSAFMAKPYDLATLTFQVERLLR